MLGLRDKTVFDKEIACKPRRTNVLIIAAGLGFSAVEICKKCLAH